jgi:beta-glucanase (GH16 family)
MAETNKINIIQDNNYLNLTMTQINGKGFGSRISTTNYFQYGRIDAILKVSKGVNVINGFYIEADNGDMVVFNIIQNIENKNSIIETNFFYKGNLLYEVNAQYFISDIILYDTFNTYTIVWYPTYYEWRLNNILLRTLSVYDTDSYPNSPSKVKLSIWEGPVSTWAGPGIKWDQTNFYTSTISSLKITNNCLTNYSYIENMNKTSEKTQSLSSALFINIYIILFVLNFSCFSLF